MARPDEHLPDSLQEAVLATLALDERFGPVIAGQVRPEHFDEGVRPAATAILAYHQQYRKPPGEGQLLAVIAIGRSGDQAASARRLVGRLVATGVTLNAAYIASRAGEFVRRQTLLGAISEATDRFLSGEEDGLVTEVEGILRGALAAQRTPMEAGVFLNDLTRGPIFLDRQREGVLLGIDPLDRAGIALYPKEMLLYVAPKNSGKSWYCVHCGRQALMQGKKVVHITLEMEDSQVVGRYYQSFFGAGWTDERLHTLEFELDEFRNVAKFKRDTIRPTMAWSSPKARKWLRGKIQHWGTRLGRLVVREFASGSLTLQGLEGYLDYLEAAEGFVPHVLIVDYPDLMEVPLRDYRLGLGRLIVGLRGLGQRRSLSIVAPTQGNRTSLRASNVHADMASEDISKVFTADTVLTYSQTEGEERLGLARLHVDYARSAARGQTVLLSQSYATGQYAIQSGLMRAKDYWERVEEMTGTRKREADEEEERDTRRRRR